MQNGYPAVLSLRSPGGQRRRLRCPTGMRQLSNPQSGILIPPRLENIKEKSPYLRTGSSLNDGGEGGIDSLRSPCGQRRRLRCPTGMRQLSNPQSGILIPPRLENIKEKSPYLRTGSSLNDGGEGGIRTPDTLPYTHFPGVLLQPLGHLTTFCLLTALGQRGATIGSSAIRVKGYFLLFFYSLNLCADCLKPLHFAAFVIKTFLN